MFIGAASKSLADPFEWRAHRLTKKIKAGVDFIQTQCIYNMDKFRDFIKRLQGAENGKSQPRVSRSPVSRSKSLRDERRYRHSSDGN